jgi:hypothetical protein
MRRTLCFALLCAAFFLPVSIHALSASEAKAIYETDSKRILSGDLQFDWKEFRLAALEGGTPYFDWHPIRNQFMQQLNSGDFDAALKSANEIKNHNLAEPEGHLLAMMAFQKMNRQQEAAFEHDAVAAFLKSITSSGDGTSSDTAYVVVAVEEEYFFLNITMGVGLPESQSLVSKDGHSFDLLKIKTQDGKEQEIWFNVDISMSETRGALKDTKKR